MCRSSNHRASMDLLCDVRSSYHRASTDPLCAILSIIVRSRMSYVPFSQSSCVHGSPMCRSSNHRAPMDSVFAVLPIIVRLWISCLSLFQSSCTHGSPSYVPFFQSSCTHGFGICRSSHNHASMDLLFAVLQIIVDPWICYLIAVVLPIIVRPRISYVPFFQSSCVHGCHMCRSPNHRASLDLLCDVLPMIVHPRISICLRSSNHRASTVVYYILSYVLPIIVRPRISICRTFFQSSCVHGSPCHSSNHRASTDLM